MAYSYSHLYSLPTTGLRFFTVYGPWGRPDMAMFLFTKAILAEQPINVFNYGRMKRDFTYIDDVIEGVIRVMDKIPLQSAASAHLVPNKIYNIGNNQPIELMQLIEALENCLGTKAVKNMLPMHPEEVPVTYADVEDLIADVGFRPNTPLEVGIERFVTWYRSYYQV
jgi:UDP-glucuronate 4-epimerase